MSSRSIDQLRRETLEVFGRDLSDQQLELDQGRLPTMLQNVRLLAEWSRRLDQVGPAQIHRALESRDEGQADG
jgi:hypothetical protein